MCRREQLRSLSQGQTCPSASTNPLEVCSGNGNCNCQTGTCSCYDLCFIDDSCSVYKSCGDHGNCEDGATHVCNDALAVRRAQPVSVVLQASATVRCATRRRRAPPTTFAAATAPVARVRRLWLCMRLRTRTVDVLAWLHRRWWQRGVFLRPLLPRLRLRARGDLQQPWRVRGALVFSRRARTPVAVLARWCSHAVVPFAVLARSCPSRARVPSRT